MTLEKITVSQVNQAQKKIEKINEYFNTLDIALTNIVKVNAEFGMNLTVDFYPKAGVSGSCHDVRLYNLDDELARDLVQALAERLFTRIDNLLEELDNLGVERDHSLLALRAKLGDKYESIFE